MLANISPYLSDVSFVTVIVSSISLLLSYLLLRSIHLLYLHPLASFPGPYQAALSTWWLYGQTKTGNLEEVLEKLHKEYNTTALRIAPNELHLTDTTLYNTIYSQRHIYTKQQYFYDCFNTPHSVFVETDKDLHRVRRKMLSNFFSKQAIRSLEGLLASRVNLLCDKLSDMKRDSAVNMYHAFRCLTIDFISDVAFGESFDLLNNSERNTFNAPFLETFDIATEGIWELMFFPILRTIVNTVPPSIACKLSTEAAKFQYLMNSVTDTVNKFRRLKSSGKSVDRDIIFDTMTHLDDTNLKAEACDILVAGSDTTASTLTVAIKEMIDRPATWKRLREEVKAANIGKDEASQLHGLEQLPFLSACVKEALRYAVAVPGRLPRVVPGDGAAPLVVEGKNVPPGSIVGISAYTMHFDPKIWGSDAKTFDPDRWLADDAKELDKYIVTFSKGARQCLGINLAYAEVTLTLARLAERFSFTRDKTMTERDLRQVDLFTKLYEGTGLRAMVHEDEK